MPDDPTRQVRINWADRNGRTCNNCVGQLGHTTDQVSTFTIEGVTTQSSWYTFDTSKQQGFSIDATSSISKFWFTVTSGGHTDVENQGGVGFVIQDVVMLAVSSCQSGSDIKLDVAVGSKVDSLY